MAFDPLASFERYGVESERAARVVVDALEARGAFDVESGRVDLDRKAVSAAIGSAAISKAKAAELAEWTNYLVYGGLATLPGPSEPALIPWRVLEDLAVAGKGTTPELRDFYGVDAGAPPRDAAAQVHDRFPALPEDVFTPDTARFLARDTELGGGGGNGDGRLPQGEDEPSSPSRPPTGGIRFYTELIDVSAAGACFARATYTGIDGGNGFGSWLLGFRVCFDNACAQKVGAAFTLLNPATSVDPIPWAIGFLEMFRGAGEELLKLSDTSVVIPSLQPLISWILFILAAGIPFLGDAITKADAGNGVCLCFTWLGVFWVVTR